MHSMQIDYNEVCTKLLKFVSNFFATFNDVDVDVMDWIAKEGVCERDVDENLNEVKLCCCS